MNLKLEIKIYSPTVKVDPIRVDSNENVDENRQNLLQLTQSVLDALFGSTSAFPLHLRIVCHCLYAVVSQRFPGSAGLQAVGTVIFLRYINPVLISPHIYGLVDMEPTPKMKRGLTLMCKIMQNLANQLLFAKELHMKHFNEFLRANFDSASDFVSDIASCSLDTASEQFAAQYGGTANNSTTHNNVLLISDSNVLSLHRLLWHHQEKIGDYLSSSRDQRQAMGRRPFDKLATLLAHLGPPEHRSATASLISANTSSSSAGIIGVGGVGVGAGAGGGPGAGAGGAVGVGSSTGGASGAGTMSSAAGAIAHANNSFTLIQNQDLQWKNYTDLSMTSTKFEDYMAKQQTLEKEDFKQITSMMIFYQGESLLLDFFSIR